MASFPTLKTGAAAQYPLDFGFASQRRPFGLWTAANSDSRCTASGCGDGL